MASYYGGIDPFAGAASPLEDPTVVSQMSHVLAGAVQHTTIGPPAPDVVQLPVPFRHGDSWITEAAVRELTGADEEALARAAVTGEPERVLDTLLQVGVVRLGSLTPNAGDLLALAVANRDALLLGIRTATYGSEVRMTLTCARCTEDIELTYDLSDVPSRPALPSEEMAHLVLLRRGGQARLRLPTGQDQMEILGEIREKSITRPEQDTLLIGRCLEALVAADGYEAQSVGVETARSMSIPDRSAILKALDDLRPGPRLDEATVTCPWCEKVTEVPLSLDILFRG